MDAKNKPQNIIRSIFSGVKVAALCLVIGMVLDYAVTQTLSQFFFFFCSEDCYFNIFNFLFVIVAMLSVGGGIYAGIRYHKRPMRW